MKFEVGKYYTESDTESDKDKDRLWCIFRIEQIYSHPDTFHSGSATVICWNLRDKSIHLRKDWVLYGDWMYAMQKPCSKLTALLKTWHGEVEDGGIGSYWNGSQVVQNGGGSE